MFYYFFSWSHQYQTSMVVFNSLYLAVLLFGSTLATPVSRGSNSLTTRGITLYRRHDSSPIQVPPYLTMDAEQLMNDPGSD